MINFVKFMLSLLCPAYFSMNYDEFCEVYAVLVVISLIV